MKNSEVLIMTQHVSHVANGGEITFPILDSLETFGALGTKEDGGLHYKVISELAANLRERMLPTVTTQSANTSNAAETTTRQEPTRAPASVSEAVQSRLGDSDDGDDGNPDDDDAHNQMDLAAAGAANGNGF